MMAKAPPPITSYCSACDARVSGGRSGAEHVQGPDGRMYCLECGDAMKLLAGEHVPPGMAVAGEGKPGLPVPPVGKQSSGRLRTVTAEGKRGGSTPGAPAVPEAPPKSRRWLVAGAVGLAVGLGLLVYFLKTGGYLTATNPPGPTVRNADPRPEDPPRKVLAPLPANEASPEQLPESVRPPRAQRDPEDPGTLSTSPPATPLPPIDRLADKLEKARRNVDRDRLRECVREASQLDAGGDDGVARRRDELLVQARAALFDAEWPWVQRQMATLETRGGPEAARAYLVKYLADAAGIFNEEQSGRIRTELEALDREGHGAK